MSGLAIAKKYSISVGWTKPPYVIEKDDLGFEVELLKAVFSEMGHELNFVYVPFGRSHNLLVKGVVDIAMTLSPTVDINPAVYSDPYIIYQNVAISLKGRGIKLDKISMLSKYTIVASQNAKVNLGNEYFIAAEMSPFYIELPDQKNQVSMLLLGRTDVVVMDINIFNYLSKERIGASHMENVDVHRIFKVSPYHLGFLSAKLRDQFNQALKKIRRSPRYQALVDKYEFIQ